MNQNISFRKLYKLEKLDLFHPVAKGQDGIVSSILSRGLF